MVAYVFVVVFPGCMVVWTVGRVLLGVCNGVPGGFAGFLGGC